MESNITIFQNPLFGEVRVAKNENGEPMFCLADLCRILGLDNPRQVKTRLNDNGMIIVDLQQLGENGVINNDGVISSKLGNTKATFISEPNLYKTIFQSRKPEAEAFTDWVASEVLPAIRKTGGYIIAKEEDTPEIIMARAYLIATDTIERKNKELAEKERTNSILKASLEANKPKVEYYNEVLQATNGHTITTIAAGYNMSAVTLNRLLMLGGVIRKTGKEYSVMAKYQRDNVAKPEKFPYKNKKGEACTKIDLRWTEKGHAIIHEKVKNAINVGALVLVKGRYEISQKWLKEYQDNQKAIREQRKEKTTKN